MKEPHPAQAVLAELVARLRLCIAAEDKAYGELHGSPVTMTVLGVEPLALLAGFKIRSPHPSQIDLPDDIEALVSRNRAEVSLERGIAWLSLDDLSEQTSEAIEGLITSFAHALSQAGVRLPDGCVRCGPRDDAAVVYSDGRCSRLCANCRDRVVDEKIQREEELNRPTVGFAAALPLLFLYVGCAWMLLWWLVDMMLIWGKTDKVVLGRLELLGVVAVLTAVAAGTGYPIGIVLRRSGIPGRTHWIMVAAAVLIACGVGEWLYVATLVYRHTGVIDLLLAAQVTADVFTSYHPTWVASKLVVAGAIGVGCYCGAKWRTASIRL
jgi:hypothetical protein